MLPEKQNLKLWWQVETFHRRRLSRTAICKKEKPVEIYTLKITFAHAVKEYPWSRTIEVSENFTLRQLHTYIQKIVEFNDDHLYEFYAGRNPRNRAYIIPEKTRMNEVFPLDALKLYYLFDFGDNWLFKIMKSKKKKLATNESILPELFKSVGENPEQYCDFDEWEE